MSGSKGSGQPVRILSCSNGCREETSLTRSLQVMPITCLIGGGGKTSTMFALGRELASEGKKVVITTTTHIREVEGTLPVNLAVAGVPCGDGKLGAVPNPDGLKEQCDYLLIEADGSRGLPVKVPAEHEPVLTERTQMVIAVLGLSGIGKSIEEACHRKERVLQLLQGTSEVAGFDHVLTPEDAARILTDPAGLFYNAGARKRAVILNQADNDRAIADGIRIADLLHRVIGWEEVPCVLTAYDAENKRNII